MKKTIVFFLVGLLFGTTTLNGQEIREYIVKKTSSEITIDGNLDETDWQNSALTELFITHQFGLETNLKTQSKILWDDNFLYIAFICEDPDVWGTFENRDDYLWNGEVVEILCDPDDDALNYFEVQVNPLETILDLYLDKAYSAGGSANIGWNLDSIKVAVSVNGTLNNLDSLDENWICEVALPFQELSFLAPSQNFPPQNGDEWRILLTRYDYGRTGDKYVELSAWNQTGSSSFHVPEKFGRIFFSEDIASIEKDKLTKIGHLKYLVNFPNPFNPSTTIEYALTKPSNITITIFDMGGREIYNFTDVRNNAGVYTKVWDGKNKNGLPVISGIYLVKIIAENYAVSRKILLLK